MKKKKVLALFLAGIMTVSGAFTGQPSVRASENGYVADNQLSENGTAAPATWGALPNANQYQYQKEELAAFCHFGPNTFNEIEWGENYGSRTPDEIFTLEEDFDADTMVKTLKEAGFKKLIVTAKHHDGFCIWASDYTTYDVAETSYKDGNGDILAEISAACTAYDMDMGLYLSPWDIHEPSYGYKDANGNPTTAENDVLDYNDYYAGQLDEILGDDKYGNAGHFNEIWMDGAKGSGANAQEYDFARWNEVIQSHEGKAAGYEADCLMFQAEEFTTVQWIGNESGIANEETWSKSKLVNGHEVDSNRRGNQYIGYEDGTMWTVPEADARITSGWFWGTAKRTPKSLTDLGQMYFNSVGHNAPLLLNVPPNNQGKVDDAILERVTEFGKEIKDTFKNNLAANGAASASEVRGNDMAFKAGNVLDGDDDTYWTTNDGTNSGSVVIDLGSEKTFDVVSIEEAIQYGQRIKSFKVEYRTGDNSEWKTFDQGTTIGAKRLSRKSAVRADQVKITVTTSEAVPMLSEIGVFKASSGFELVSAAPEGMDVLDNTDNVHFSYSGWTQETGQQYINGTNMWANPGKSLELTFDGTKVYLMGTLDPNHGTADIYIDGEFVETIDTHRTSRAVGQKIFISDDLEDGEHTLRLEVKNKAIGLEAAYVINNGGKGMIELEKTAYTMNEDETMDVVVNRIGGTTGEVTAILEPNPGSAIQDDFDTTPQIVTFADGESQTTVPVTTRRNTNETGDQEFSIELTTPSEGLIIGFTKRAAVTIKDADGLTKAKLQELVDESNALLAEHYSGGWDAFTEKLSAAAQVLESEASDAQIQKAYNDLETAKGALVKREKYTAQDPFRFPWKEGSSSTLEAEFAETLINTGNEPQWYLQISEAGWASNGKFINCLDVADIVEYAYYAEKPGTYKVTVDYRSGDPKNALSWTEKNGKIEPGVKVAGAGDAAQATHTETFELKVLEAGAGTLVFTGPADKSPQLDKFVIEPLEIVLDKYTVTAAAGEGGSISPAGETEVTEGDSVRYEITASDGYVVEDVLVNGESVGAVTSYEAANISADMTIEAKFAFVNYTAANPFAFPTQVDGEEKTLEAEHFILRNTGDNEAWPLETAKADWASNGTFVNSLNTNDQIILHYYAEKAGSYEVKVTFRSGDSRNALVWAEENGKIEAGEKVAGANDGARNTHTETFTLNVLEAGAGVLTFTGPQYNSPQLDKFDFVLKEVTGQPVESDKSDLEALVQYANDQKDVEGYDMLIPAVKVPFETALEEAEEMLNDATVTQEEVNAMYAELLHWVHMLSFLGGDNTELKNKVDMAEQEILPNIGNYTAETAEAFIKALEAANKVLEDENAFPEEIEKAKTDLQNAIDNLVEDEKKADMSRLQALVEQAREIMAGDVSGYVEESVATLESSLAMGELVLTLPDSQQSFVDMVADALEAAITGLTQKEPEKTPADKSELIAVYEAVKDTELDKYTEESASVFANALEAAKAVIDNETLTEEDQAVVDRVKELLQAAFDELTLKAASADKTALKKLIDKSLQYVDNADKYTEESYTIFKEVYDLAVSVYQNTEATQAEVDAARTNLEAGRRALREVPNKDKLEELLEQVAGLDLSLYTAESAKAVKAAYAKAAAVLEDKNATQVEVNNAVKALETATQELKEEKSDKKAVAGEAGDKVASDNGKQTTGKTTSNATGKSAAKTGDAANMAIPAAAGLMAVLAAIAAWRKRTNA